MNDRFDYVEFDASSQNASDDLRQRFQKIEELIVGLGPGRSVALALTHLEECYMWVGKSIRDAQLAEDQTMRELDCG